MPSYLVIAGIDGDSRARGHEGSIEIESWSFGVPQAEQRGAGSGRPVGRGTFRRDFRLPRRPGLAAAAAVLRYWTAGGPGGTHPAAGHGGWAVSDDRSTIHRRPGGALHRQG